MWAILTNGYSSSFGASVFFDTLSLNGYKANARDQLINKEIRQIIEDVLAREKKGKHEQRYIMLSVESQALRGRSIMKKLSIWSVFSKYRLSFSDYLARWSYSVYRNVRLRLSRIFPLKEYEEHMLKDIRYREELSSVMPQGYNNREKKEEAGFLRLKYIDFFDYLPKEDLPRFKKEHNNFVRKNKLSRYGVYQTSKDRERLDFLERYVDWKYFSRLPTVEIKKNRSVSHYISYVATSIRNLSSSFLLVAYRFYITEEFNQELERICKSSYGPYSDVSRQFNIPWYNPKRFGRAMFTGDDARKKEYYQLLANLKWNAFVELRRTFTIHFLIPNAHPERIHTSS